MSNFHFPIILIWALPASGKSEVLTFLRRLPSRNGLCIGPKLVEIDDYPRFASYKQIDDERERNKKSRLFTHVEDADNGGFLNQATWDDMDQYLNARFDDQLVRDPNTFRDSTMMIECARGGPVGASFPLEHGYQKTLENLDSRILQDAVILYVRVSPEEAQRRNEARFDPAHEYGILSHHVPRNIMRDNYGCDDIDYLMQQGDNNGLVRSPEGFLIPIGIFENEDDKTSFVRDSTLPKEEQNIKLYQSLERVLKPLYASYCLLHH